MARHYAVLHGFTDGLFWVLSAVALGSVFVGNDGRCCVQLCRSHRTRCAGSIRGKLTLHIGHFRERHPLLVTESWVKRGPAFELASCRTEGAECTCRRAGSAVERPKSSRINLGCEGFKVNKTLKPSSLGFGWSLL